jgi:serine kinase of HPr protein (carbohydrate metabolism regulator)
MTRMQDQPRNLHATAVLVGDRGILITGPSGAGKTTLALWLADEFGRHGHFARLVADDQVFVRAAGGRLVVDAPSPIEGLAEVPGIGPRPVAFERSALIDIALELTDAAIDRIQPQSTVEVAGCRIARVLVPARNAPAAMLIIKSILGSERFGS